jgi:hypothetical protein
LGSISTELALRRGVRDDVVANEGVLRTFVLEVVQLRAVVRDERTGLHGGPIQILKRAVALWMC